MSTRLQHPYWRRIRASWRDTQLLTRQFAWPLSVFALSVIGGGIIYHRLAGELGEPIQSLAEAIYHVLGLSFLSPVTKFPNAWQLQLFYFIMPVIMGALLALGVADFGFLFFNRRARGKEWEMAIASTFNDHVILIGLGHLGFNIVQNLRQLGLDLVVIEIDPNANLVEKVRSLGIPIIEADATLGSSLIAAQVGKARTIMVCTQSDSVNLQIALKARTLNADIHVVIRIFDQDFGHALKQQFGFSALSATNISAPTFAAAAAGVDMTRPITIEGQPLSLACFEIQIDSLISEMHVAAIEHEYDVSVVFLRKGEEADLHPPNDRAVEVGDTIGVIGTPESISPLVNTRSR